MQETGVPGKSYRLTLSHWQLSHISCVKFEPRQLLWIASRLCQRPMVPCMIKFSNNWFINVSGLCLDSWFKVIGESECMPLIQLRLSIWYHTTIHIFQQMKGSIWKGIHVPNETSWNLMSKRYQLFNSV